MRSATLLVLGIFLAGLAALAPAAFAQQPQAEAAPVPPGRGVSGSPTPLAGARVVGAVQVARQPGQDIDLLKYRNWSSPLSNARRPQTFVVRNQQEWITAWRNTGQLPPKDLGSGVMAVAIFIGSKQLTGYSVGVASVKRDGEDMYVTYVINSPQDLTMARREEISPWVIQELPLVSGRVRMTSIRAN